VSGRRCKALRKGFKSEFGRLPEKTTWETVWVGAVESWSYRKSEWRRLKRAWLTTGRYVEAK
jgi:hypothetical protein